MVFYGASADWWWCTAWLLLWSMIFVIDCSLNFFFFFLISSGFVPMFSLSSKWKKQMLLTTNHLYFHLILRPSSLSKLYSEHFAYAFSFSWYIIDSLFFLICSSDTSESAFVANLSRHKGPVNFCSLFYFLFVQLLPFHLVTWLMKWWNDLIFSFFGQGTWLGV